MRILLAQNSHYFPAFGGGDKSNRLLMEALAERGHHCRVLARRREAAAGEYLEELAARGVAAEASRPGLVRFTLGGVTVEVCLQADARPALREAIASFAPDVILLSTDDPAQLLLETALDASSARLVYLVRTTLSLPFGPEAAFPSEDKTERLRRTDAVVAVSRYVADYVRRWSGIEAVALPISLLEPGPWPALGRLDNEFVTMVNPCAVKGISIFLALADALPQLRFAAVPTWGATAVDLEALRLRPNVTILPPADDIERILQRTRVMLVPSLWAEARGRIVVEAMLRGVPVLASNVGGIAEAMMGMDYLLPVRPIARYQRLVDEKLVPVAEVPEQDIAPWRIALEQLLSDPERYSSLARASRQAALDYAARLSVEPLESLLRDLAARPRQAFPAPSSRLPGAAALSPEKRALLTLLLKRTAAPSPAAERWFPFLRPRAGVRLRLFCFPYAGGGAAVFRSWAERLPPWIGVCPARLPGRESRLAEPPLEQIEPLLEALAEALGGHLDTPYAWFGHSFGALLAFELARRFEQEGRPRPVALLVAGARAPQFRRQPLPDAAPDQQELLAELRELGGAQLLDSEELRKLMLPALRADCTLARRYCYQPGPPLEAPIRAYAGAGDARLSREAVEAWKEQTRSTFRLRLFPGGHFFLHTCEAELLGALSEDLTELIG
jgi:surfactin synthase thioesterase subunit/glycosyltransferase involved in cell wall biosynthesis